MKKGYKVIWGCVIVAIVVLLIVLLPENPDKNEKPSTDTSEMETVSIFKNEIPPYDENNFAVVSVKCSGSVWVVNGIEYTVQKTVFPIVNTMCKWEVDLSAVFPYGKCDDVSLFSFSKKGDADVLVGLKNDTYYLLSAGDVLSSYRYSPDDFTIDCCEYREAHPDMPENKERLNEDEAKAYLQDAWDDHLSGDKNLAYLLFDSGIYCFRLRLNDYSGLIYCVDFVSCDDGYYSYMPFKAEAEITE